MNIMIVRRIKKIKKLIFTIINAMKINQHDTPLGYHKYRELSIGDLVQWSELSDNFKQKSKKVGIISDLYVEHRGRREVAIAKVHELTNSKPNLTILGVGKEVLVINLEILSKVNTKNDEISL
tara:strand:+ start:302 stop:670 length:369 start_codon:yes stop_codon:yes gene_type:complete